MKLDRCNFVFTTHNNTFPDIDVSRLNYKYLQESRSITDKPTRFFCKSRVG